MKITIIISSPQAVRVCLYFTSIENKREDKFSRRRAACRWRDVFDQSMDMCVYAWTLGHIYIPQLIIMSVATNHNEAIEKWVLMMSIDGRLTSRGEKGMILRHEETFLAASISMAYLFIERSIDLGETKNGDCATPKNSSSMISCPRQRPKIKPWRRERHARIQLVVCLCVSFHPILDETAMCLPSIFSSVSLMNFFSPWWLVPIIRRPEREREKE